MDLVNTLLDMLLASPWALAVVFLVCAVDAFLPIVPSETVVIAGGVLAASGEQSLLLVIVLAALGSFAGDHASYLIGRHLGGPVAGRLARRHGRSRLERAAEILRSRGGLVIVVFRFIPGGRTGSTLAAGALGYPLRRFTGFDAVAAACWGAYAAVIGYAMGGVFEGNRLLGVGVGLGISVAVTLLAEAVRLLHRRRVLGQLRRFLAVGAANAAVDVGVFNLLLYAVPTRSTAQLVAFNTVALLAALVNSYLWNTRWTFAAEAARRGRTAWRQRSIFAVQAGANLVLNDVVLGVAAAVLSSSIVLSAAAAHNIAKLLAMATASIVSFVALRFVVFRGAAAGGESR